MWSDHALPVEVSPALQPTSESWTSEQGLLSSVAGASDSELQEREKQEQLDRFILKTRSKEAQTHKQQQKLEGLQVQKTTDS